MRDAYVNVTEVNGGPLRHCDDIHAEIVGLLKGLKLTKSKGINGCIVEGVSLSVISWGKRW